MFLSSFLLILALLYSSPLLGGEYPPAWLKEQLPNISALTTPGVYKLKDSRLFIVGQGKAPKSLRDNRTRRFALDSAEQDAKQRVAKHLAPEIFKKYKNVSVSMRYVLRVFEQHPTSDNPMAYVGIVVNPGDVSVNPLPDISVILDAERAVVPAEMLQYLEDPLLQLGGGKIYSRNDGWIVVGVGVASLFGNDSVAERDAMKRARLEAGKAIAETIFGGNFDVMEQESESALEKNGVAAIREWASKRTRENIEGELKRVEEVGHWRTTDGHMAVVVAVSNMPINIAAHYTASQFDEDVSVPDYPDWEVEPVWEYVLLSQPRLLKGGAILFPDSGVIWIVGVGAAKLTGNMANDQINAPRAAMMDAQRNITRYLQGFATKSNTEAIEEVTVIFFEDGLDASSIVESLQKLTQEKTSGMVRGMQKTGSWKSSDRKLLYHIYVVQFREIDHQ